MVWGLSLRAVPWVSTQSHISPKVSEIGFNKPLSSFLLFGFSSAGEPLAFLFLRLLLHIFVL
ncbi:hypothetical protein BWK59_12075 [Flavobacterium davisii]|uniref:Uncharacterized protein n=1 Tax=Flavobacterium davisii TaxID=2906077 RepID=A0A246GHX9_9FLAO|nr:hypothetical protein BWK59_12075 [Flavobacterium davisii]